MLPPWQPLLYLKDPLVLYVAWISAISVSILYVTIIVLPNELATYYGLNQLQIGLCYLPFGVGAMIGSNVGGKVTQIFYLKFPIAVESQLVGSMIGIFIIIVSGFLFGWTIEIHLACPLIFSCFVGFGMTHMFPGVFNFCILRQPMNAGGITAGVQFVQFGLSAIAIILGQSASSTIGNGLLFSILCSILLVFFVPGVIYLYLKLRIPYTFSNEMNVDSS